MSYQREYQKRIKAAVIGAGSHCYRNILPSMTWLPVELEAICDVSREAAFSTARQYGCRAYTDTAELYEKEPDIEAVFISVGAALHPALVTEALDWGKHVWVEKPVALRASQVEEMLEHVKDKIVVTGLKKAFTPAAEKARELAEAADFGHLNSVLAVYPMCMPKEGKTVLDNGSLPNWLRNGVHPLSFLIGLCGPVRMVQTIANQAGYGVVMLQFDSGVMGTLHLASGPQPDAERYSLFADNWQLDIEGAKVSLRRGICDFDYRRTTSYLSPLDKGGTVVWDTANCVATLENKAEFVQGMVSELNYFCDCVLTGQRPVTGSLEMTLEVMKVYEAALVSEGKPVFLHPQEKKADGGIY